MSQFDFLENGFFMIKQDERMASPIASVFYETYKNKEDLEDKIKAKQDQIQCIVGPKSMSKAIPFGTSQSPGLNDYADGVDTMDFLLKL